MIPGDQDYFYPFAKFCNNETVAEMDDNYSKHGIWIDIFPMDNLPEDDELLRKLFKKTRFWRAVVISMTTKLSGEKSVKKKIAKLTLKIYANLYGKRNVVKKANEIAQSYNGEKTVYIGGALWGYGPGERLNRASYLTPCELEAMYLSRICIVSNVIGNNDVIQNGVNGFICNNVEEYVECIKKTSLYSCEDIILNARNDVLTKYNVEVMANKYKKIYEEQK